MGRLLVHPEQASSMRYHVPTQRHARATYQRPIITRAQAARVVEVELLRAVMSEAPERER